MCLAVDVPGQDQIVAIKADISPHRKFLAKLDLELGSGEHNEALIGGDAISLPILQPPDR